MERRRCISCGYLIYKSGLSDPYLCRECEEMMLDDESRYTYLDSA